MKKHSIIVMGCYALLSVLATYPLIFNLTRCIYGPFYLTDVRGSVWFLSWLKYAFIHHLKISPCIWLNAPQGLPLDTHHFFWISFFLAKALTIVTGPLFTLNALLIAGFVLSGMFAYRLVHRLTNNKAASFLSGVMFAFSPYHLNKMLDFGHSFHACWLVFFVVCLLKQSEEANIRFKIVLTTAIALVLTVDFNIYYAFFAIVFALGFLVYSFIHRWIFDRQHMKSFATFFLSLLLVFLFVLVAELPFVISLVSKLSSPGFNSTDGESLGYIRSFSYLVVQSARPFSYIFPASTHPVFGGFTRKMFGSFFYGRGPIEQTLFLGWVPLILAGVAFRRWKYKRLHPQMFPGYRDSKENFYIGFFIFSACLAFLFSLPPFVDLIVFKIYFPSYFIYRILPMFRAYARFGVVVMLCVAVLAGYGLRDILERIERRSMRFMFLAIVFSAILFEFMNMPPSRVTDISKVPAVYTWLADQEGDFIVAEYPMVFNPQGEAQENYDYLFEQTRHRKRLMNGIFQGGRSSALKDKIIKIESLEAPVTLKSLGVKYVILHENLYRGGAYRKAVDVIGDVPVLDGRPGFRRVKTFKDISVFEIV